METEPDSLLFILNFQLTFLASVSSVEVILGLLFIVLLLIGSALVSGSEVAYFSLSHNDLDELKQHPGKDIQRILYLKEKPRRLLATILISNNFINIAIVILSEYILNLIFDKGAVFLNWSNFILAYIPLGIEAITLANIFGILITVIGVTFLLVLFGEVAPKIYAKLDNIRLAKFMSGPLLFLMRLFNLPSSLLIGWTNAIERKLGNTANPTSIASLEEIGEAIDLTVSDENKVGEVNLLKRIVKFGEVSVKQIMCSRADVIAVDFRLSFRDLLKTVRESGYSRIPVYENDFDNVTGILYAKDLLSHLNKDGEPFKWQELIRTDVIYVPEAKKIDDLLKEFQKKQLHMAIVVDEYGGSSGIVTLEDILEEIIGEIKDEFDDDTELIYRKIDDHNFVFEGKTLLQDIYKVLSIPDDTFDAVKGDADSLAGLVLELLGELPKRNAVVEFDKFQFKIISVDKRRIKEIQITLSSSVDNQIERFLPSTSKE